MKKRNLLAAVGLSFFGLGLTAASSRAAAYANDNLLLAFYATGGEGSTTSVVLNIGPASLYRDAGSEFFLSTGSIGTDLVNAFGADWHSRDDVHWGVFGSAYNAAVGTDAAWTLYGARAQTAAGTQSQAYNLGSIATQSQPGTRIKDLGDAYATSGAATGLTVGVNAAVSIQDRSADNDFAEYQSNGGGTSFGYFNAALANFAGGAAGSQLDLFRLPTGASTAKGTYEGTFSVGTDGVVRFSTVPNPSPTPTPPAPTPAPTPVTVPPSVTAAIQKKITAIKKQLKAAKSIDDPAAKAKKIKALKKKLKKLQQQLNG